VLPRRTRTRQRSCVPSRAAGKGCRAATSAASAADRGAFRRRTTPRRKASYAARSAKSRLPRSSSACATASLNRRWACSQSPFSWPLAGLVASAVIP